MPRRKSLVVYSMMEFVLDLHLHSRFSRAVSQKMNLLNMYVWGRKKGIHILSVSDFTHPIWFREARSQLEEVAPGLYGLKDRGDEERQIGGLLDTFLVNSYFLLTCEVSSIYSEQGKVHKIHNLIFSPSFEIAEKINKTFLSHGFNLSADGRPILGISSKNLAELLFSIDKHIFLIPCHAWTPWFSLYGSRSGYDSIDDCFGSYAKYISAIETGLSSDPSMNWRIKELDNRSIVSFSDAHSLEKMGREATVIRSKVKGQKSKVSYADIISAFKKNDNSDFEIAYTIEFYPEEGKYHYTGHRLCGVSYSPLETHEKGTICPVCRKPLTVGVMHRVDELAKTDANNFTFEKDGNGVVWVQDVKKIRPPYVSLVPLLEILSEAFSGGVSSLSVVSSYENLVSHVGSELRVLLTTPFEEIRKIAGEKAALGIEKVRSRNIKIMPGFDGEYGKVSIWNAEEERKEQKQLGFGF